ncbi:MAG: hypothetical protein ABJA94_06855 [Rhodoglobus sp.]
MSPKSKPIPIPIGPISPPGPVIHTVPGLPKTGPHGRVFIKGTNPNRPIVEIRRILPATAQVVLEVQVRPYNAGIDPVGNWVAYACSPLIQDTEEIPEPDLFYATTPVDPVVVNDGKSHTCYARAVIITPKKTITTATVSWIVGAG